MSKNAVIAGDYENCRFVNSPKGIVLAISFTKRITLNKETVESYEVMDETETTSMTSAVGRGLIGSFLLGPAGLLAGLSAKKKGTHVVAVQFNDGKKSLLELDDKLYKTLMTSLF